MALSRAAGVLRHALRMQWAAARLLSAAPAGEDASRVVDLAALRRERALRPPSERAQRQPPRQQRASGRQLALNQDMLASPTLEAALDLASSNSAVLNHVNVATALVTMSRLVDRREPPAWLRDDARFAELLRVTAARFGDMDERGLATTLHACGRLGAALPAAWTERFWKASAAVLHTFVPQALSNALYACMKLQIAPPDDWLALYWSAATAKLPGYSPQAFSNTLYACAMMELNPPGDWLDRFWRLSAPRLGEFTSQDLTNSMYSFGILRCVPPDDWLGHMWDATALKLPVCNAQDLSNLMHSCVRLRLKLPAGLLPCVWDASAGKLDRFQPQELSSFMYAFGHLRQAPPEEWLQQFWRHSVDKLPAFKTQELSNTLFMCSELNALPSADWLHAFSRVCEDKMPLLSQQQLANIALALSIFSQWELPVWHELWQRLCLTLSHPPASWSPEDALSSMMLYQAYGAAQLERPGVLPEPPAALLDGARACWHDGVRTRRASGPFHDEVSNYLYDMAIAHVNERWCERAERSIDIAIEKGHEAAPIAVEVDGPHHFLQDGRQTGTTLLRNRTLAAHGWRVVVVDYRAWRAQQTPKQREEYLRRLLA
jgi:hypothetical protein